MWSPEQKVDQLHAIQAGAPISEALSLDDTKMFFGYRSSISEDHSPQRKQAKYNLPSVSDTKEGILAFLKETFFQTPTDELPSILKTSVVKNFEFNLYNWYNLGEMRAGWWAQIHSCCQEQVKQLDLVVMPRRRGRALVGGRTDSVLEHFIKERCLATLVAAVIIVSIKTFNNHDIQFVTSGFDLLKYTYGVYSYLVSDYWFKPAFRQLGDRSRTWLLKKPISTATLSEVTSDDHDVIHGTAQIIEEGGLKPIWELECVSVPTKLSLSAADTVSISDKSGGLRSGIYFNTSFEHLQSIEFHDKKEDKMRLRRAAFMLLENEEGFQLPCQQSLRDSGELGKQL